MPNEREVYRLEKLREIGCEVVYEKPKWVEDKLEKGEKIAKKRVEVDWKEITDKYMKRVKKKLAKQYTFNI